jgi:hypothetical protein
MSDFEILKISQTQKVHGKLVIFTIIKQLQENNEP